MLLNNNCFVVIIQLNQCLPAPAKELEDFVGAQLYCLCALANDNYLYFYTQKTAQIKMRRTALMEVPGRTS